MARKIGADSNAQGIEPDNAAPVVKKSAGGRPKKGAVKPLRFAEGKQTFQNESVFWRFVSEYPGRVPGMSRNGISIFVFRLWPVVDNGLIDKRDAWQEVISDETKWNREYLEGEYGGGVLMLKLMDANATPKERARTFIRFDDPEAEPKLNLRTLDLHASKNASYIDRLVARGELVRNEDGSVSLKTGSVAAGAGGPVAPPNVYSYVGAVPSATAPPTGEYGVPQGILAKIVERALAVPGPDQQLSMAFQIADRLHPTPAPAPALPAAGPVVSPARSLSGGLHEVLELYRQIKELVEPATAAPVVSAEAPWWVSAIPQLARELPAVLAGVASLMRAQSGGAVRVSGFAPAAGPMAVINGPGQPQAAAAPALPAEYADLLSMFSPAMQSSILRVIPLAVQRLKDGMIGSDVACGIVVFEGADTYRALAGLGPMKLMLAIANFPDPEIQQLLLTQGPRVAEWVDDFLNYNIDGDGAESESDERAVA